MPRNILYFTNNHTYIYSSLNFVSAYLSRVEHHYRNPFPRINLNEVPPDQNFIGVVHSIKGRGTIKTRKGTLEIGSNELAFVRHVDILSIETENSEWEYYFLWFFLANTKIEYNRVFSLPIMEGEDEKIRNIIQLMNTGDYYKIYQANGLGQALIGELLSAINTPQTADSYYDVFHSLMLHINENVTLNFSVAELAAQCNLCEKQFRTLFAKYAGLPPKQYIINCKLERARFLLVFTANSVSQIANELSFLSPSYFVTCFKKHFGCTPTEYRLKGTLSFSPSRKEGETAK